MQLQHSQMQRRPKVQSETHGAPTSHWRGLLTGTSALWALWLCPRSRLETGWAGMMLVGICDVTLMFMFIMNDIICYKPINTQMHISIHSWKKDGKGLVTFHFVHRITGFNLTFLTDARGQRSTKRTSHLLSFSCVDLICTHGMPGTIQNPSWLEIVSESAALLIVLLEKSWIQFLLFACVSILITFYISSIYCNYTWHYFWDIFFCEVQVHVQCPGHIGISNQLAIYFHTAFFEAWTSCRSRV